MIVYIGGLGDYHCLHTRFRENRRGNSEKLATPSTQDTDQTKNTTHHVMDTPIHKQTQKSNYTYRNILFPN